MVYADKVWAVIGSIDGAATHLAEQVVAKARLTLINPVSTDRSIHGANVPWMFSCVPGDHLLAPLLVRALDGAPFTLLSATDHDSRAFVAELKSALVRSRVSPASHIEFKSATSELAADISSKAVVLIAGARDSARIAKALRQGGFAGPILGGPWMGRRIFIQEAGAAAEGVLFPLLAQPSDPHFADYAAAHAHDAARLLIAAIRQAGLNRARIRDAVQELSGWQGTTGAICWDNLGQNERPVALGTVREGRVAPAAGFSSSPAATR
jgi:ABC-type branched-subunit amino acid transport system substrate-binding protein